MTTHNYLRALPLFEWTFGLLVANFTLQIYRLAARLMSIVFDVFKLSYSKSLFGPLNENDLKPYDKFFSSRTEIVLRLVEDVILVITSFYAAKSLLAFSVAGLVICCIIFSAHVILLLLGAIFLVDFNKVRESFSINVLLWIALILVEMLSALMPAIVLSHF